jgi:hypothetical protein
VAIARETARGRRRGREVVAFQLLLFVSLLTPFAPAQNVQTIIYNLEHQLAQAEKQQDRSFFENELNDRLIYVAFNGLVLTKSKLVSAVSYIDVSHYRIENMKVRVLGADAALATYDLTSGGSLAGHDLPGKQYASSVWVKNGGNWQLIFHQSTPAHHD